MVRCPKLTSSVFSGGSWSPRVHNFAEMQNIAKHINKAWSRPELIPQKLGPQSSHTQTRTQADSQSLKTGLVRRSGPFSPPVPVSVLRPETPSSTDVTSTGDQVSQVRSRRMSRGGAGCVRRLFEDRTSLFFAAKTTQHRRFTNLRASYLTCMEVS